MEVIKQLLAVLVLLLTVFLLSCSCADDFLQCLSQTNTASLVYTPNNSTYSSILKSYIRNERTSYSAFNARKPAILFTPLDESHIQAALHCSKLHGLQIRVCSGGHDYEGLSYISSETTPFVIIDLRNLSSISIDTTTKTAWIQAGATLGEVYYSIAQASSTLSFPAGSCPTVGVGGHFSGGGYGMMSRKFGLSSDNIIDAKLIDANGRILDRKSMGEDLFWAIRGGGGASFGIIVSWKVRLLDVPEKVTVFNVTRTLEQNATQLLYKWQHISHKVDNNLLIRIFITFYANQNISISFTTLFLGGVEQLLHEMQKSFPELGVSKEDCIEMSWLESVIVLADSHSGILSPDVLLNRTRSGQPGFSKAKSDYVQQVIPMKGLKGIWKLVEEGKIHSVQVQFSPLGGAMNDRTETETPFPHRYGNIFMIHYVVGWEKMEDSTRHVEWLGKLYRYLSTYVSKSPRAAYINYRDLDLGVNNEHHTSYAQASIWGIRYFNNNFKRLVQVKTRVDPYNFFRNEQSIPPLSKQELRVIKPNSKITFLQHSS